MQNTPGTDNDAERRQFFNSLLERVSAQWPQLPDKPEENPSSGIRALWFAAAGKNRSVQLASEGELPPLSADEKTLLNQLIERRLSGVPLAHLVGWQRFMGLEFKSGPQALIPRKETEILANAALKSLREVVARQGGAKVMDICTGSGNLAISLAAHVPDCLVYGADICSEAVALAKQNAEFHKLQDRVSFQVGDLFGPFADGKFDHAMDLIVCNPPYLSTGKVRVLPREIGEFEPREAFDAGAFGLAIITRLINEAPRFLKPGARLCFEVGLGQGPFFEKRLKALGLYRTIEHAADEAGEVRVLIAEV